MADETILRQVFELEQIIDELFTIAEPSPVKNSLWQIYMRLAGPHPGDTEVSRLPDDGDYIIVRRSSDDWTDNPSGPAGRVLRTEGDMYYLSVPGSGEMAYSIKFYPYRILLKKSE